MAYDMLLSRIPANILNVNNHTTLRRDDYPNVQYWTRQDWNSALHDDILEVDSPEEPEQLPEPEGEGDESKEPSPTGPACRGKHRSSQGINVTMKYIEYEDGMVVDGFRAAEIRRYARSLWVQMALESKLPRTWSEADARSLATYNQSMGQRFPELRLCAGDWKANLVATDNYPSWRHNWLKKNSRDASKLKRPGDHHSETSTKRSQVVEEADEHAHGVFNLHCIPPAGPEGHTLDACTNYQINSRNSYVCPRRVVDAEGECWGVVVMLNARSATWRETGEGRRMPRERDSAVVHGGQKQGVPQLVTPPLCPRGAARS